MTPGAPHGDEGITLVELLIAVFVGAVLLGLVATIFVTTLQANAATRDRDLASGRAQAISTSLATGIRNAAAVTVQPLAAGGTVVRARVAAGASGWECRAWAIVDLETWDAVGRRAGADGRFELRAHTSSPLGEGETPPEPASSWGTLTEHVEPSRDAAGAALPYVTVADRRVSWNLAVATSTQPQLSDGTLAPIAGSAVVLARQDGASSRCW